MAKNLPAIIYVKMEKDGSAEYLVADAEVASMVIMGKGARDSRSQRALFLNPARAEEVAKKMTVQQASGGRDPLGLTFKDAVMSIASRRRRLSYSTLAHREQPNG